MHAFAPLQRFLPWLLAVAFASCWTVQPASAANPPPSKLDCAAYYLTLQFQLQLLLAVQGKPPVTIGPASDWAAQQLKGTPPSEANALNAAMHKFDQSSAAAVSSTLDPAKAAKAMTQLQTIVDLYDGDCQQTAGQEAVDLAGLTAGKYRFEKPPAPARPPATSVSELECAYYYMTMVTPIAVHQNLPLPVLAMIGPIYAWADKVIAAEPDTARKSATFAALHEKMDEVRPKVITTDGAIIAQPVIDYYDPSCRQLSGLQPFDLKAIRAAAAPPK